MTAPPVHALVLSGGGAHAAYSVGVVKALFSGDSPATSYIPLDPQIYTGTSGGAVNAAILVSQTGIPLPSRVANLENIWVNQISNDPKRCSNAVYRIRGNPFQYLNPACFVPNPLRPALDLAGDALFFSRDLFQRSINFLISSGDLTRRILGFLDFSQFISSLPIEQGIHRLVSLEGIRRSDRLLKIMTTNWTSGELTIFQNHDLTEEDGYLILLASASVPGIFPPHRIHGELHVDGGLVMNTPLMPAIDGGADTLHVIYLDPDVKNIPLSRLQNSLDTLDRSRIIDWAIKINEDISTARWINQGLETLERISQGAEISNEDMRLFVRVAARIEEHIRQGAPYRKLTVHCYHPRDDTVGPLGLLNFDRDQIIQLIERGYSDAALHNCEESHCLLPSGSQPPVWQGPLP